MMDMRRWFIIAALFLLAACGKEVTDSPSGRGISFEVADGGISAPDTRAEYSPAVYKPVAVSSDIDWPEPLYLYTEESEGIDREGPETRGAQVNELGASFSFGVSEFKGTTAVSTFQNLRPRFESTSSTKLFYSGHSWEADAVTGTSYDFYAYSPYVSSATNGVTLNSGNKTITYNNSSVSAANQPDLMTAYASSSYVAAVPMTFQHRLCAVRVVLASDWAEGYSVTGIKFGNIITSGTFNINAANTADWTSYGSRGTYTRNDALESCLMMVPQTMASNSTLTVTLKDRQGTSHTLSATLTGSWTAGKTVTYTLRPKGITSMTVTYPTWAPASGSGNIYGPVDSYDVGANQFGLYAVNKSGTVVYTNIAVGVKSISGHVATLDLPDRFYSSSYTYYIYYPYKTSPGGVTASGTTAEAFFSTLASSSGWSVSTTQNSLATYKAQDLQLGKGTVSGTSVSFSMAHRMGLAKITLANKTVPNTRTYTYTTSGWSGGTNSGGNVTLSCPRSFNSTTLARLLDVGSTSENEFWTIVKATGASASESVSLGSNDSQTYRDYWTLTLSGVGYGKYKNFTAQTAREANTVIRQFEFTNSIVEYTIPTTGAYWLEVWGAQGYSVNYKNAAGITTKKTGGYGGYSCGQVSFTKGEKIYILVGQEGVGGKNFSSTYTFPNGGGGLGNSDCIVGCGGGASMIITKAGVTVGRGMSSQLTNSQILILAGGGGASCQAFPDANPVNSWGGNGGAGGGNIGYNGTDWTTNQQGGKGGTQSAGGEGRGPAGDNPTYRKNDGGRLYGGGGLGTGDGSSSNPRYSGTGGGGGYYGGGGSWGAAGGGGSGYIGNSRLSDKKMVSYFKSGSGLTSETSAHTSSNASDKTESTENVSATATANYAKIGNGYVRITSR